MGCTSGQANVPQIKAWLYKVKCLSYSNHTGCEMCEYIVDKKSCFHKHAFSLVIARKLTNCDKHGTSCGRRSAWKKTEKSFFSQNANYTISCVFITVKKFRNYLILEGQYSGKTGQHDFYSLSSLFSGQFNVILHPHVDQISRGANKATTGSS